MPIKRIPSPWDAVRTAECDDADHDPPTMIVLDPGAYEHTCPKCGKRSVFVIRDRTLRRRDEWRPSSARR